MEKIGIISHEQKPVHLLNSLHELGVKNPIVLCNEPELENHFLITVCQLIIIDDHQLSFSFIKQSIKNGCNLLFMHLPLWDDNEINELIPLLDEAKVQLYFFDDILCAPSNLLHLFPSHRNTLIDCNLQLAHTTPTEYTLFRILLLLTMLDDANLKHVGMVNIPPRLSNLRFSLHSGTALRMLLQTSTQKESTGFITLYRAYNDAYSLDFHKKEPSATYALSLLITPQKEPKMQLPNFNQLRQALNLLAAARKKVDYADFFRK